MCSRYSLTSPHEAVRSYFKFKSTPDFPPRYNIAPTQPVGVVRIDGAGERELALVRWGLIPSWVKDPREFSLLTNARAETAPEKPSFRAAFRHRRCLVPADAFYEWTGPKTARRPFMIQRKGGGVLAFAGLHEHWMDKDGSEMETMAILTVAANAAVGALHDRMPAILEPETFETWLDCKRVMADEAHALLQPAPDVLLELFEVSRLLNNARNEGPQVQERVGGPLLI